MGKKFKKKDKWSEEDIQKEMSRALNAALDHNDLERIDEVLHPETLIDDHQFDMGLEMDKFLKNVLNASKDLVEEDDTPMGNWITDQRLFNPEVARYQDLIAKEDKIEEEEEDEEDLEAEDIEYEDWEEEEEIDDEEEDIDEQPSWLEKLLKQEETEPEMILDVTQREGQDITLKKVEQKEPEETLPPIRQITVIPTTDTGYNMVTISDGTRALWVDLNSLPDDTCDVHIEESSGTTIKEYYWGILQYMLGVLLPNFAPSIIMTEEDSVLVCEKIAKYNTNRFKFYYIPETELISAYIITEDSEDALHDVLNYVIDTGKVANFLLYLYDMATKPGFSFKTTYTPMIHGYHLQKANREGLTVLAQMILEDDGTATYKDDDNDPEIEINQYPLMDKVMLYQLRHIAEELDLEPETEEEIPEAEAETLDMILTDAKAPVAEQKEEVPVIEPVTEEQSNPVVEVTAEDLFEDVDTANEAPVDTMEINAKEDVIITPVKEEEPVPVKKLMTQQEIRNTVEENSMVFKPLTRR